MYSTLELYINGRFRSGEGRPTEAVRDPASGDVLGELPHASREDLDEAICASERAFAGWRAVSSYDRAGILRRAAQLLRERLESIATVMTLEQGKILAEARAEVGAAADIFDWNAEEGRRTYGRIVPSRSSDIRQMVLAEAVGPSAVFTPWNFPALTPARKIGSALAAGCTVVIKPSEETPGTAVEIVRALDQAGLPPGVLNLVFGVPSEISKELATAKAIRKISFTGSTSVGKQLLRLAADGVKRTTMELGGNAPVLVFPDSDLDSAARACVATKYRNAGQVCIAPSRFFVHESVHDRFVDKFVNHARSISVGNGRSPATSMGPLANARRADAMEEFLEDARGRGGQTVLGGRRLHERENFFEPTIVTGLEQDARLFSEETFGPIAPIIPFADTESAIAGANKVDAGLAAYAFTSSSAVARQVSDGLQAGMVGINSFAISHPETPFGGIKESGHGQEGGTEGLQSFLNVKLVVEA